MNRGRLAPPTCFVAFLIALFFAGSALCSAQVENVLARFNATTDGGKPVGGLIADSANNLYGTTIWNSYLSNACLTTGSNDCGTVFQLSPGQLDGGPWIETVLYRFTGGLDGSFPTGPLARDQAGNLYGTTTQGGDANNDGTIFELSPPIVPGDPWTKTTLHVFAGSDGSGPHGLIMDGTGNLFGTASEGGCNFGTVFELSPGGGGTWTFQTIYVLGCGYHFQDEGLFPGAAPIRGPGGDLYGTTPYGWQFSAGTIYKLVQPTPTPAAWRFKVIYSLQDSPDGAHSDASLTAFGEIFTGRPTREARARCSLSAVALCSSSHRPRIRVAIGVRPRSTNFRVAPTDPHRCRQSLSTSRAAFMAPPIPEGILRARASFTMAAEPCTG